MMISNSFDIKRYDFDYKLLSDFQNVHYAKDNWPIVYILSDNHINEAYVGETTDTFTRITTHLRHSVKNKLSTIHLILSEKFNKSATLDIESNLIKYISGDGQYKLLNANLGLANHNYYQKNEVYWDLFNSIWDKLRADGIAKNSIQQINNSDLFKYSPYKNLTIEQRTGLLDILNSLYNNEFRNIIVDGGAGTGKTILAIFIFKLLNTPNEDFNFKEFEDNESDFIELIKKLKQKYPNPKMALVVPMSSFRNTLKKVFKNIKGLNAKMVIGPSEITKEIFDIVLVDESHRLRQRVNLTNYAYFDQACRELEMDIHSSTELDWVIKQSKKAILFYDENQSIKPSDVAKTDFDKLKASPKTKIEYLKSQFRVKGGNGYVKFIDELLNCKLPLDTRIFQSKDYELILFESIDEFIDEIKLRNKEYGLARAIAGYSWEWKSKNDKNLTDIKIEDLELRWNSVSDDYINSPNSVNEVGCIHTTQGYDLNYAGIIFGNEITYNKSTNEIVVIKENYHDKNGKMTVKDPEELKKYIINIYKTIMLRGIKGTYVYVCDKNLREYFSKYIEILHKDEPIKYINNKKLTPDINAVPIYDLKAAAGEFSELQNAEHLDWVEIPSRYKFSEDLFACKVIGESMNKIIPNGSLCLFRVDRGGSRNGKIVLVQYTNLQDHDFGSGYTVKEYSSKKSVYADQWSHEAIILKPRSNDPKYQDIVIPEDDLEFFKVVGIFECVL